MPFSPRIVHALLAGAAALWLGAAHAEVTLLNVSYDVTRELYKDINPAFIAQWKQTTGERITVEQSHGGSSKQAQSVANGLEADVVTMNQSTDIDLLARSGLVPKDWRQRLPHHSAPYTLSLIHIFGQFLKNEAFEVRERFADYSEAPYRIAIAQDNESLHVADHVRLTGL